MVQSGGNGRLTAFVSTMVAVAILAAGVTARQGSSPETVDVVQHASDLRFQFEMAFRHNERERDERLEQLDAVMAEWQVSTQSDADRAALVAWLETAGANSLPGALQDLPAQPEFLRVQLPVEHKVLKSDATKEIATRQSEPTAVIMPKIGETPVTPTAVDPLEEEIVALRQPQSLTSGPHEQPARSTLEVAPRPGMQEPPKLMEDNLLASVTVAKEPVEPVGVNLTELAARIAGYHDGLNEVDTALLRMDNASLETVAEQINKLDAMTRDYSFVELYYESLTDAERRRVLSPRSMESTITEVERQLTLSEAVLDGDFLGSFDKVAEKEIAALRARLAGIRERVKP